MVGLTDTQQTAVCDESCRVGGPGWGRDRARGQRGLVTGGGGIWSCSTEGNDSIAKLAANGHQQSIGRCTAAQTRVPLTGLCQSVNTALANYNLTACNLRLSKLRRRSTTLPPLSRSTPRALGGKSVWRCQSERTPPSTPLILGGRNLSQSKWTTALV